MRRFFRQAILPAAVLGAFLAAEARADDVACTVYLRYYGVHDSLQGKLALLLPGPAAGGPLRG